jgi:hypothetical protein
VCVSDLFWMKRLTTCNSRYYLGTSARAVDQDTHGQAIHRTLLGGNLWEARCTSILEVPAPFLHVKITLLHRQRIPCGYAGTAFPGCQRAKT